MSCRSSPASTPEDHCLGEGDPILCARYSLGLSLSAVFDFVIRLFNKRHLLIYLGFAG